MARDDEMLWNFTLVELVVVSAIITLLIALMPCDSISYGLGAETRKLSLIESVHAPSGRMYGCGYLPAEHRGIPLSVQLNNKTLPIENMRNASSRDSIRRQRIHQTPLTNHGVGRDFCRTDVPGAIVKETLA